MINVRTLNWFSKYANFDQCNYASKKTFQIYQEQVFYISLLNNKTTIYKKTNTHTFVPRIRAAVRFLWVLFHSSSLQNSSRAQNEMFAEIQWDCQIGFI